MEVASCKMLADNVLFIMNDKQMAKNYIPKLARMRLEFSLERLMLELMIEESNTWLFTSTEELTSKFGTLKGVMN